MSEIITDPWAISLPAALSGVVTQPSATTLPCSALTAKAQP